MRRGYDPHQVDARVRELEDQLADAESARNEAEYQARAAEAELHAVRSQTPPDGIESASESFGLRADRVLRLAEYEAAAIRNRAGGEAEALVETARSAAELHLQDSVQAALARATQLGQEVAERSAAVREREQRAATVLAAAREQATRIVEDARSSGDALLAEARSRAEEIVYRSEQEVRDQCEAAEHDLLRIIGMHDEVRTEMVRLHQLMSPVVGDWVDVASGNGADDDAESDAAPA